MSSQSFTRYPAYQVASKDWQRNMPFWHSTWHHRQTERQTNRQTDTDRQTNRQT